MNLLKYLWSLINNEHGYSGSGGGGEPQRQITEMADPTPEQKEANQLAIQLAQMQGREAQRQTDVAQRIAPQREELLQAQLEAGKAQIGLGEQRLGLTGQAIEAYKSTLDPTELQTKRESLQKELAESTLAKLRGEKDWVSPQKKERLAGLEQEYISRGTEDIGRVGSYIAQDLEARAAGEGRTVSPIAMGGLEKELALQAGKIERGGRITGLATGLGQTGQLTEQQRQFGEQLNRQSITNKLNNYLVVSGKQGMIPTAGIGGGAKTGQINALVDQMKREREGLASSTTYGQPMSRSQTGTQGAMSGAMTGMSVGTSIKPGLGTAIGGVVGAVAGGIYGYNA
jgi:hypothetical protein